MPRRIEINAGPPEHITRRGICRGWDLGFTGSRHQLTEPQEDATARLLYALRGTSDTQRFHHGDNKVADCAAGRFALLFGYRVVAHPPSDPTHRGYGEYHEIWPEKPYLERNKDVVNESMVLIAAPDGPEHLRSGTWSTIRFAIRHRQIVIVIRPDAYIYLIT